MYRFALVAILLFAGCELPKGGDTTPEDVAHVAVSLGKTVAIEVSPQPAPDVKPDNGKCDNCDGSGWLGDSRVFTPCPVCNADGKKPRVAAEPIVAKEEKPTVGIVEIYTFDGCVKCDEWKLIEQPKLEKAGWRIEPKTMEEGKRFGFTIAPSFHVKDSRKEFFYSGYMSVADFNKEYNK